MTLRDFTKQPRGPLTFDVWKGNQAIPSPMGEFTVELQMAAGDPTPPDDEMVRHAEQLVTLFRAHVESIYDKVFEHYQMLSDDRDWLRTCGVAPDLDRHGILEHLQVRTLSVTLDGDEAEPYVSRVYVVPAWDEEHAIYLAYQDGAWEFVDC